MNEYLHEAQRLGALGIPTFPCRARSKEPAIKDWDELSSCSNDQLVAWWSTNPTRNLAAAVPEDLFVIDLEGKARNSIESAIGHRFPDTMRSLTPGKGGGEHLWYRKDPGVVVKNRVRLMKGMDVRAKGGYVMVPPSVHPEGGRYSWANKGQIVEAPDWLIQMCQQSKVDGAESEPVMSVREMLAGIPVGMQRWVMFRYACSRRTKGYDADELKLILWGAISNSEQDRSRPWRREHIDALVDDVWNRYDTMPEKEQGGPGKMWTPGELATHVFATNKWIVKPLLRRGVTVLSSHAKTGKSMMIATLLKSIAVGESVWGQFESQKTGVLCLDLEQEEESASDRWKNIMGGAELDNLRIFFSWPRMDKGGLEEIRKFLMANADVGVVVIDTWAMFNPAGPSDSSAGLNEYYREYDVLGQLKRIANEMGVAIIVVHHFSKNSDRPSGTVAFEGAPDGDWRLHRESGSRLAVLKIKGKNTPETSISFNVDLRTHTWEVSNVE